MFTRSEFERRRAGDQLDLLFALAGRKLNAALAGEQAGQRRLDGVAGKLAVVAAQGGRRGFPQFRARTFRGHNDLAALSQFAAEISTLPPRGRHSLAISNKLTITRTAGRGIATAGADQKIDVGANQTVSIASNRSVTVGVNDEISAASDMVHSAGANLALAAGADLTADASANVKISGAINVEIAAGAVIKLSAGGSSIEIGPAGVTISSPAPVTVTGATIKLN